MHLTAFLLAMRSMWDGLTKCSSAQETRQSICTAHPTGSKRLHRSAQQAKEYDGVCVWSRQNINTAYVLHANVRTRLVSIEIRYVWSTQNINTACSKRCHRYRCI